MLSDELEKADSVRVLAAAAGLQLVGGNIHHLFRLKRLAAFAARHDSATSQRVSAKALRRILKTPEIGSEAIQLHEDEFEGFVTAEVPCLGRTYLVLQGLLTDSAVVARNLLGVVFDPRHDLPVEFTRRVHWAARLLLQTSATLAQHNGLERYSAAPKRDREITVPGMPTIEDLAERLTYDESALLDGFTPQAADYLRSKLFTDAAALPPWDGIDDIDEAIIATPFIRTSRGVIIAAPFELMAALRHLIGTEAVNYSCASTLTEAASEFAARIVTTTFGNLCDDDLEEAENSTPRLRVFRGRFDVDKFLDLRIRVEPFDNYDPSTVFQQPVTILGASEVEGVDHPVDRILVVDVVWSHGSGLQSFTEANGPLHLTGEYSTFETILFSPGTHQLTMWYFARALERWPSGEGHMMMASTLDAYAIYNDGDEQGFYASDDGQPTAMFITSGSGEELRRTVADNTGKTYVHDDRRTYEAFLVHGTATTVRQVIGPGCLYYAEFPTGSAWVQASASAASTFAPVSPLGEAACFWLYKLGIEFPDLLDVQPRNDIRVSIDITAWETMPTGSPDSWITHQISDSGTIRLAVTTPPEIDSQDPPNVLDRVLLASLIRALESMATAPLEVNADEILNAIAPAGQLRMIHVADHNSDPVTWPGKLPQRRNVVSAVVASLLDDLGNHLSKERGYCVGSISDDLRTSILNKNVVPYFGDRLSELLSGHDDRELLRYLIRANEALLRETRINQETLPSRIACFGRNSDLVERFTKDLSESTTAAVSSRFLIEYVAGNPACGGLPVTTESYDLMLALASEVTNKGFLSDAIHAGISTATVSMLPSGRFGIGRDDDRWVTGMQSFLRVHASTTVDAMTKTATAEQPQQDSPAEPFDLAPHDRLADIEFGFTFTDLKNFVGKLLNISIGQDQDDVGELLISMIHNEMIDAFGWDTAKVKRLLDALSMQSEIDFWRLGIKVHPWRYNRERSYLRKPLIRRSEPDGDYIVFGHRNACLAPLHWYGQYDSGRLQAKTPVMKKALSEAINRKGELFENRVETVLAKLCSPVRRRVRKIGRFDLRNIDGRDIGDIDLIGYHGSSRTFVLIEAKSLESARTPAELRNEIANILDRDHSAVTRLKGRYEWVREHLDTLRNEFGIPPGKIALMPVIVIDNDLATREFKSSPFPIVPLDRLVETISQQRPIQKSGNRRRVR